MNLRFTWLAHWAGLFITFLSFTAGEAHAIEFVELDLPGLKGWCAPPGQLVTGDFDGDRRTDLMCHDIYGGRKWISYANPCYRNAATTAACQGGTQITFLAQTHWEYPMGWCYGPDWRLSAGDTNGDGRDDLICWNTVSGVVGISHADLQGHFAWTNLDVNDFCHAPDKLLVGNFDGTNGVDLLCHSPSTGIRRLSYAQSNGTYAYPIDRWSNWCDAPDAELKVGDFDADGIDDVLCYNPYASYDDHPDDWWLVPAYATLEIDYGKPLGQTTETWDLGEYGVYTYSYYEAEGILGKTDWSSEMHNLCVGWGYELEVGNFDGLLGDDLVCRNWYDGQTRFAFSGLDDPFRYVSDDGVFTADCDDPGVGTLRVGEFLMDRTQLLCTGNTDTVRKVHIAFGVNLVWEDQHACEGSLSSVRAGLAAMEQIEQQGCWDWNGFTSARAAYDAAVDEALRQCVKAGAETTEDWDQFLIEAGALRNELSDYCVGPPDQAAVDATCSLHDGLILHMEKQRGPYYKEINVHEYIWACPNDLVTDRCNEFHKAWNVHVESEFYFVYGRKIIDVTTTRCGTYTNGFPTSREVLYEDL